MKRKTGRYERTTAADEAVDAFVPDPLPPSDPPLALDSELRATLDRARGQLSRLDLAAEMVPSVQWFIYGFVRKEAVLTSQIEGTQATLVDLLEFEAKPNSNTDEIGADIEEVCNYLAALDYARDELDRARGLPISVRLLNEAHRRLMRGARGANKRPGEIRQSQNWIGGTRPGNAAFVPTPPHLLSDGLSDLEHYIHGEHDVPPLVRIGLVHVQFETLHPYLDGNGRIGRLLVALLLEYWGLLREPLLYLSHYLKRHQHEYYRRLDAVRAEGDWEGWLRFFLEGVEEVAEQATSTARELNELVDTDRRRLLAMESATMTGVRLFESLPEHPVVTVTKVVDLLETTRPTAGKAVDLLEEAEILVEVTGRKRDRVFHYQRYVETLEV